MLIQPPNESSCARSALPSYKSLTSSSLLGSFSFPPQLELFLTLHTISMSDSKDYKTNPGNDENYVSNFEHSEFHGFDSKNYEYPRKLLPETIKYAVLYGADRALMARKSLNRSKGFNQLSSIVHSHSVDDVANLEACKAFEKKTKAKYCLQKDDTSKVLETPSRSYFVFSLNFVMFFVVLLLKLVSIQFSLFTSFFIKLIRLSSSLIMFPFRTLMGIKKLLIVKFLRMCIELISHSTSYIYSQIKGNKSVANLGLKISRALFWSVCACLVLMGLLFLGFLVGGIATNRLVEQPIKTTEALNFDYTKNSPVAFVPVKLYNHKLQLTIALILPESEYNRKLGMFQVKVELLSAKGKVTASSSHPCILEFKSPLIRFIETFFKTAPIIAGFQTESQILKIKIRNLAKQYEPDDYLKVALEQRAEYNAGAGIPQIYDASLTVESELSKLKAILWFWRRTIFVIISLTAFWTELVTLLIFSGCYIMPRGKVKAE